MLRESHVLTKYASRSRGSYSFGFGIKDHRPSITAFTLSDDNLMLQDLCLSTMLLTGLLLAAFSAAGAISAEIETTNHPHIVSNPQPPRVYRREIHRVMAALLLAAIS
jgi:hypothetical protein